ncbi:MAG: Gfo/Idh/MocA family oxidoreductase [Pseudomonadota bacterium]
MIRIAVIGAGLIGRCHVEVIERVDGAEVACVVDPAPDTQTFAAERGLPWAASIAEMLTRLRPDGAIIATPNTLHVPNGMDCVAAGMPILIEKPIADDTTTAQRLIDQAATKAVPILVGHHRRHNPIISAARARIDSGALGAIVAAHAQCWFYKPDQYFATGWRKQKGAGPIFINLIHDIDLMRHLIGEVDSVHAFRSSVTRGHAVEDTAVVSLRFANGALGTVTVSDAIVAPWSWELTAAENPAYPATGQSCYLIGGTRGSLEIPTGTVWSQDDAPSWWKPIHHHADAVPSIDPLDAQIAHFCDVINGAAPLVSGAEGLASLKVIEAIHRSAETGMPVSLI